MDDTSPEIAEKMRELMQKKTMKERLEMTCSMIDASKKLVTCGILHNNPTISPRDLKKELFLKFYGDDFDSATKEEILKYFDTFP